MYVLRQMIKEDSGCRGKYSSGVRRLEETYRSERQSYVRKAVGDEGGQG